MKDVIQKQPSRSGPQSSRGLKEVLKYLIIPSLGGKFSPVINCRPSICNPRAHCQFNLGKMASETSSIELKEEDASTRPHTGDASTLGDSPMAFSDLVDVETLTRIATEHSRRQSTPGTTNKLAVLAQQDSSLDPQSGNFDLRKWLKAAVTDISRDGRPGHTADVLFKKLNVYGSGAALQFQNTVTSALTAPLRLPQIIRHSHSPQRRILKDFHGLLKSGELLLVLGRPGAGCSTLLKSMTGELHGLNLDPESVIHYNGRTAAP
jgi:ATP-binding cassette subfamily G (WHITE) protein 2 (PDR)